MLTKEEIRGILEAANYWDSPGFGKVGEGL